MRHPELTGRMRTVIVLNLLEQMLHAVAQQRRQLGRWQRRIDRLPHRDRDRHLGSAHVLGMPLGPDALGAPDDVRNDRHIGVDGHPGRTGLQRLDLEAAADGGLRVHTHQLTGPQRRARRGEGVGPAVPVDFDMAQLAHDGSADLVIEDLFLGHETHLPAAPLFVGGQTGEGEIEVAGVVDRDHRTTGDRQVLHPGDSELQALQPPHQAGGLNDSPVYRLHGSKRSHSLCAEAEEHPRWR